MYFKVAMLASLVFSSCCFAEPVFPNYPYFVPAVAKGGGPVYVIPGAVTESSTIGFSVSGMACEQGAGVGCMNAAGVVTAKGLTAHTGVGQTSTFTGKVGGYSGTFHFGALLMSIAGVGTVQVFPASAKNGLGSMAPPQSFTLATASFANLGFKKKFSVQNAQITFYVADNAYGDNAQGFLVNLVSPTITYNATAPTRKIIQVNGPCDWAAWDQGNGPCYPTAASGSGSEVLGDGLGNPFEDGSGNLVWLFGDTIGVQLPMKPLALGKNIYPRFQAADAIATGPMPADGAALKMDFFPKSPKTPQFVTPSNQPDGTPVLMGGDDVPNAGIHVNGKNYIVVNTGHSSNSTGDKTAATDYSVIVEDDGNISFKSGRTLSIANKAVPAGSKNYVQTGHFVFIALAELPLAYAQQIGLSEPVVLMVGNAEYRAESLYLAYVPMSQFSVDKTATNTGTMYFTGLGSNGMPTWSATEMDATPVVYDNPTKLPASPDPGTLGNASMLYNADLGLWFLTYDGGRQSAPTTGIYFSVASSPWGPWSKPQLVYNACDGHKYGQGFGDFIYYVKGDDDPCGGTVDNLAGPRGPIIGTKEADPFFGTTVNGGTARNTRGGTFAPSMVPGLTTLSGSELSVDFNMSTWNPYAVVLMESNFSVAAPKF